MKRYFWFRSFEDSTTLSSPQENGLTWKSLLSRTRIYRQSKIPATEYSRVRWREGLTNAITLLAKSRWRVCLLGSPNKLVGKTKFVALANQGLVWQVDAISGIAFIRKLTSNDHNMRRTIVGDFDIAHDRVCFCRIAPWDCQEDAVTHDLARLKRTLSRMSGSVFCRSTFIWDCMGLQKNAVTPDWVGVLLNCTVVLSRDTVLSIPSLSLQVQPKSGQLQMVSKIISKWKNHYF